VIQVLVLSSIRYPLALGTIRNIRVSAKTRCFTPDRSRRGTREHQTAINLYCTNLTLEKAVRELPSLQITHCANRLPTNGTVHFAGCLRDSELVPPGRARQICCFAMCIDEIGSWVSESGASRGVLRHQLSTHMGKREVYDLHLRPRSYGISFISTPERSPHGYCVTMRHGENYRAGWTRMKRFCCRTRQLREHLDELTGLCDCDHRDGRKAMR
jgi:hypothetical protein